MVGARGRFFCGMAQGIVVGVEEIEAGFVDLGANANLLAEFGANGALILT